MFSSTGLFKQVPCPQNQDCSLPRCVFSHDSSSIITQTNGHVQEYDPFAAGLPSSPPIKKRKLEHPEDDLPRVDSGPASELSSFSPTNAKAFTASQQNRAQVNGPSAASSTAQSGIQNSVKSLIPATAKRLVTPPLTKRVRVTSPAEAPAGKQMESLVPRPVPKAPDLLKKRLTILQGLLQQLQAQNKKANGRDPDSKAFRLTEQEMVKFALDEEEKAAVKYESEIYRNHVTQLVFRIKKMSEGDWRSFVTSSIRPQKKTNQTSDVKAIPTRPVTHLSSIEEENIVLRSLRTSLAGLEEYGYVTKRPTAAELASTKEALEAAAGWEKCDRCETRFQVFPGRDGSGRLTTGGTCRHHWAKWSRPATPKASLTLSTYTCCNKSVGSEGCTEAESHVFKVTDKKRLATILQFEQTPENSATSRPPVAFDCEMGYTTLGMEAIRVTAVSWPDGRGLLDVLVRPYGEVLDLNTRYSGVSMKEFMEAPQYEDETQGRSIAQDQSERKELCKTSSPATARGLLFDLITPETPLIGHAIDNDLNVLRIIHPTVVDTVLLYPHPKGLPVRFGLKALASKYLDRHIQTAGDAGHDSKEDALATGDLVTVAVAEKWKRLRNAGWKFESGKLVAPDMVKKPSTQGKATLWPGMSIAIMFLLGKFV